MWGRVLEPGRRYALVFVNNANASVELSCDTACFTELLDGAPPAVRFLNLPKPSFDPKWQLEKERRKTLCLKLIADGIQTDLMVN